MTHQKRLSGDRGDQASLIDIRLERVAKWFQSLSKLTQLHLEKNVYKWRHFGSVTYLPKSGGNPETTLSDGRRFERLLGGLWQDNAEKAVASIAEKEHSEVRDREL